MNRYQPQMSQCKLKRAMGVAEGGGSVNFEAAENFWPIYLGGNILQDASRDKDVVRRI